MSDSCDVNLTVDDAEITASLIVSEDSCVIDLFLASEPCYINLIISGGERPEYARVTFIGDGSGNQVIELDGAILDNSDLVFFSGVLGERDIDYTIALDKQSITITKIWLTGRPGEIRYVKN